MKRSREKGMTLLEVVVGVSLLSMSSTFLIAMLFQLMKTNIRAESQVNLSLSAETVARSWLTMMNNFMDLQSARTTAWCNTQSVPTFASLFNNTQFGDLQVVWATTATQIPSFVDAPNYNAARARCLNQNMAANNGDIRNLNAMYFCAMLQANGDTKGERGSGGSVSRANQTVLIEFSYQVRHEKTGQNITCANFSNYPMAAPPGNSSPLMANLYFTIHSINRKVSTDGLPANSPIRRGMIYTHKSGVLRGTMPYVPASQFVISDLMLAAQSHNTGRIPNPAGNNVYRSIATFSDCSWGTACNGLSMLWGNPILLNSLGSYNGQVVTDLWINRPGQKKVGGVGTFDYYGRPVPTAAAGYAAIGGIADCWPKFGSNDPANAYAGSDNPAHGICYGNLLFMVQKKNYSSIPTDGTGRMMSSLWITPVGSHIAYGLDCLSAGNPCCPKGFDFVSSVSDCDVGTNTDVSAVTNCVGKVNVCALYVTK